MSNTTEPLLDKVNDKLDPVTEFLNIYADPLLTFVSRMNFFIIIVLVIVLVILHFFFRDKETSSFKHSVAGFIRAVLIFAASAVGTYNVTQFFITPSEYSANDLLKVCLKVFQAFGTVYLIYWSYKFSKAIIVMLEINVRKEAKPTIKSLLSKILFFRKEK